MDKITKALKQLSPGEQKAVKSLLEKILNRNFENMDIKKLKGYDDIFRIRKGKIRIVYRIKQNKKIFILAIERRNDKTYKFRGI